ncbi:MAG: metallophosphoesterase [Eggerthellaceae bacterium]
MSDTHIGVTKTTEDSETTIDPSEELADGLQVIVDKTEGKNRQAVFNLGDVTNKGVDEDAIDQYLDIIATYGEASKTPYHQVIGNHDLYNFGRYETSTDIAARTLKVQQALSLFEDKLSSGTGSAVQFYSFDHVNFILIGDTSIEGAVDGNSLTSSASIGGNRLSDATRESLNKRLLQTVRQGRHGGHTLAIVMCHYPYYNKKYLSKSDRNALYSILTSYPNTYYFAGHRHNYAAHGASNYSVVSAASLSAKMTSYNIRTGYSSDLRYSLTQIGIDSTCGYLSGSEEAEAADSSVSVLEDTGSGDALTLHTYDVTAGTESSRKLVRRTGSVKIASTNADPAYYHRSAKGTYQVVFSDGGTYSGIASGAKISLKTGKSKTISGIPAGVLVTVRQTHAKTGYKKAPTKRVEVYAGKKRTAKMKSSWKAGSYLVAFCKNAQAKASKKRVSYKMLRNVRKQLHKNTFKRSGYRFAGWNTKKNGTGKKYRNRQAVKNLTKKNGTIKLYAQWKPVKKKGASRTLTL